MDDTRAWASARGGVPAFAIYVLFLLSIPSFALFALVGVITAYVTREGSGGLAREHIETQIRIWWIAFLWGVALLALGVVGWALTPLLIGFPILWLIWTLGFVVMIWFTVKSAFGLIALLEGRPPSLGLF
jgi:uncharacterized membrane protein